MSNFQTIREKAFAPIDATSVVVFRIGFGFILVWEVWRYLSSGWIDRFYINPGFYFKYYGFEWVQPWNGDGMYLHFILMGLFAFLVLIGAAYRLSIILFTLSFSYVFLLDQTRYLNHFYLVILFSILLCVIPAHRYLSVDARLRPKIRSSAVPMWTVWVLRAQMEIMLLYAGFVKINADWLQLEPLRMWLAERGDFPFIFGYLFTQDWSIAVAAYGIIILHVIGAPLLLWKRTRLAVFCCYAAFHILNHFVFTIGIFPWFTLFASLVFFDPDWPKQVYNRLQPLFKRSAQHFKPLTTPQSVYTTPRWQQNITIVFVGIWTLSQILIPLRHWLYPGNVSWTEQGHRFSWQMKLRDKAAWADFYVIDPNDRSKIWHVEPKQFLTKKQTKKMATRPDMVLQFAHYLAEQWAQQYNLPDAEVKASVFVSLNGRRPALIIDPERDLAKEERNLRHADWILPLSEPLNLAHKSP